MWPWEPAAGSRISPALSAALKLRREAELSGGKAIAVPHPGLPSVQLDGRKWPEVTLLEASLETALAQDAETAVFLDTTLWVQAHPNRMELVQQVATVLADQGTWHWVDVVPASMPSHWLFTVFPALWTYVQEAYWNVQQIFKQLQQASLTATVRETTFYQAISLETAVALVRQRPGLLQLLADADYQRGLAQLEAAMASQGPGTLLGSEFTLAEVTAIKNAVPRKKRGGKQAAAVE
ncbi:MAG: hypothetical protein BWY63_02775 [Chloroflexi bacterium ADurb.Bin360]|nr:MAG: hypothetical protein BWY63_02775 [Chloroflexi bacterium ADurb.Bin360]